MTEYAEVPGSVTPDVPYWVNQLGKAIGAEQAQQDATLASHGTTLASHAGQLGILGSAQAQDKTERVAVDATHAARLALVEAAAGFEEPPLGFQDEVVAGLLVNAGTESGAAVADLVAGVLPEVTMFSVGAIADGVTDDWTYFNQARTLAGAGGTVHFGARRGQAETVYWFDRDRPAMGGVNISADPSVVIKILDEDPATPNLTLLTPVTFESVQGNYKTRRPSNGDLQTAVAMAANVRHQDLVAVPDPFTAGGWAGLSAGTSAGALTRQATTAVLEANKVSWPAAASTAVEGMEKTPVVGEMYEFTVLAVDSAGGQVGPIFIRADNKYGWLRAATGTGIITLSESASAGYVTSPALYLTALPTPNGEAYQMATSITWGVKFRTLRLVSIYVNGLYLHDITFSSDVVKFGCVTTSNRTATLTIVNPVKYTSWEPSRILPASCSLVGDSITFSAWSPISWGDLLPVSAAGLPGGGDITVRQNLAVSGSSAYQWADPGHALYIGAKDFTADDFVLVMLGTNDVQGSRTPAEYEASLATIAAKIVADGAVPIFGVFPTWTHLAVTGTGGGATKYNEAAGLRSVLVRWALENGHGLAMVNDAFGANIGHLPDNIHPDPRGQAAIARAFAQAIARHRLAHGLI